MGDITNPRNMDDFLRNYNADEIRIASEFLSNWMPFLSCGLCQSCTRKLSDGIRSLHTDVDLDQCKEDEADKHSLGSWKDEADCLSDHAGEVTLVNEVFSSSSPPESSAVKKSWADMAMEDEFELEESNEVNTGSRMTSEIEGIKPKVQLSRDEREHIRFSNVERIKDFITLERINGKLVNILEGLELHKGVFSAAEQKRIVNLVEELQEKGKNGQLKERTYSAPAKWMRGKGRVTLQFGCCYNYATDKNGNPPGILKDELVDPLPNLLKTMIKRLITWHVMPPSCVPDSCIVNIYEEGDCIPPHIDNHDFVRPFCTVSFLSECKILFGSNLKIKGPGEFAGSYEIALPVGSVLVLKGNGADVAKHCVPAVPYRRISITFRRMDVPKRPFGYRPEPDLIGLEPLSDEVDRSKKLDYKVDNRSPRSVDVDRLKKPDYKVDNRASRLEEVDRRKTYNASRGGLGHEQRVAGSPDGRFSGRNRQRPVNWRRPQVPN